MSLERTPGATLATDVLVVGAGPAGVAAAVRAAEAGRRVLLVDDNATPGGQIWRAGKNLPAGARTWLRRLHDANVDVLAGTAIVHADGPGVLYGAGPDGPVRLSCERLVLATGSQELFLPFPGWTLPGVFGAGGLQALVQGGLDVDGKRVLVAGSGPLLWSVAADLRRRGADVVGVAEQAPFGRLARFAAALVGHPGKIVQSLRMTPALRGVPRRFSTWPIRAHGDGRLESVTLRHSDGREQQVCCEVMACGFGLVPDTRLAALLGCLLTRGRVDVDALQRTTVENVWAAGESTGVGGADAALVEGQIAGLDAVGQADDALERQRHRQTRFTDALERAFQLRPELREIADDGTVVCRCENATWGDVRGAASAVDAKLRSRCGMGPCQGRVCGPALAFLRGFESSAVRPPLFPVPLSFFSTFEQGDPP